jgi:carbon-monoxide dehydrogenase large subunit
MANFIGVSLPRREDRRLLTGTGEFVADVRLDGALHAAVLRSRHANARIRAVDASGLRGMAGVVGFWDARSLSGLLGPLVPLGGARPHLAQRVGLEDAAVPQPVLAEHALYAGQPIGVAVARDRATAEDALERVRVDAEPLPAVVDPEAALDPGAPRVHPGRPDNVAIRFEVRVGDAEAALAGAEVVVRRRIREQRYTGVPMETRGTLARWSRGRLTVWSSTQVPHLLRSVLAGCLALPEAAIRVVAPDVGGGFGPKCSVYPEEVLVAWLARHLGRPVRWIEDRGEHFLATWHSRDQLHDVEMGLTSDGRIVGLRDRFLQDSGAFNYWGFVVPYNTAGHLLGPYRVPHYACEARSVFTHKVPNAPYRGAGRPDAVLAMERTLDAAARRLGIDPLELRRRNLVQASEMPYDTGLLYRDGAPLVYDSGDFPAALEAAAEAVDYEGFRRRQASLRQRGVHRGIGFAAYVEGTGIGPYEGAVVRLDAGGRALVCTGAAPQGQGHETTLAQVCAERLGVRPDDVTVVTGDTAFIAQGVGTFASRSAVVAGNAVAAASEQVRRRVLARAARLLEASEADLVAEDGRISVRGAPGRGVSFAEACRGAAPGELEATDYWSPPTVTFASAFHAAEVEVDAETGRVELRRYVVVHDCGRVINPAIADGQVAGGVAQGIGGALLEEIAYDGSGQPLTGTLADYLLPTGAELPRIELHHRESPSPLNPLGVKGLGEGGAISPPAAIAAAVSDALAPLGAEVLEMPVTPERVVALIRGRGTGQPQG